MNDWRTVLRDADADPTLPADRAQQIRQSVVAAAAAAAPARSFWPLRAALAGGALVVLLTGTGDDGPRSRYEPSGNGQAMTPSSERRQLRFSTPGGTRIIWELNPDFTLTETLP